MAKLEFNEQSHEYRIGGNTLISVTQLLQKHGITPSFDCVNESILKAASERGTLIHKEIENYVLNGEMGFTDEMHAFVQLMKSKDINIKESELQVHSNAIAGTVDAIGTIGKKSFIGDYKTGSTISREAWSWQLSLYEYLIGKKFDKMLVFHLRGNSAKIIELERIEQEEIERLLDAENLGKVYVYKKLEYPTELLEALELAEIKRKKYDARVNELKIELLAAMEAQGVKRDIRDGMTITYTAPTTRESIDTKKLQAENPIIAKLYTRVSNVKSAVRIKLKKEE